MRAGGGARTPGRRADTHTHPELCECVLKVASETTHRLRHKFAMRCGCMHMRKYTRPLMKKYMYVVATPPLFARLTESH